MNRNTVTDGRIGTNITYKHLYTLHVRIYGTTFARRTRGSKGKNRLTDTLSQISHSSVLRKMEVINGVAEVAVAVAGRVALPSSSIYNCNRSGGDNI